MSEEEKTVIAPEEELVDPIETMVRQWLDDNIEYADGETKDDYEGLSLSVHDLGTLILNCFDGVQETMMESMIPPGTTIH